MTDLRPEVAGDEYSRAESLLDLIESDFGQSGRDVRIEAIACELHRLTDENARMRGIIETLGMLGMEQRTRADKAEAERDALRKRIEDAPIFTCESDIISGRAYDYISAVLRHDDPAFQYPDLDGKRVLLVVEE